MKNERTHMTIHEAAKFLGLHPATLRGYVKQGLIGSFQTGAGKTVFSKDHLDKFIRGGDPIQVSFSSN